MSHNPYMPPRSDVSVDSTDNIHLYSPKQAACGALIGGPVGLIYFLRSNFENLGNGRSATNTLIYGVILIVALLIILPLLPDKFPSAPFSVAYIVAARNIAEKYQISKQGIMDSDRYEFHSNWRVVGYGILCFLGSVIVIAGPLAALHSLGFTA
jgi:hypothetical protein